MSISFVLVPFLILMVLLCTAVPVLLGVFVYRDANARGMEPLLWTLLAVFAPGFIGLIVYLVVRRDHFKLMCPKCGGEVQQGFVSCPSCGQKLSANCSHCGTALRPEWKLCPQCGSEVTAGEPFATPVVVKPQTKGLGVAIAAVLALPVAFVFFTIVCFIGLRAYAYNIESELGDDSEYIAKTKIALEEFSQASDYIDLEILTLNQAQPEKEALAIAEDKYVDEDIHSRGGEDRLQSLDSLPTCCAESADCLEKMRAVFEAENVFRPRMIDGILKSLRAFGDRDLHVRASKDPDLMKQLVETYFYCG